MRYKGVAQVTSRRARKGFQLRLDINRDTGFRLITHKQYSSPVVVVLTTHTDYVNRYPSTLQTSSYRTNTSPELCAGIVKAVPPHDKKPLNMLQTLICYCKKKI